jgi:hypothetical protein
VIKSSPYLCAFGLGAIWFGAVAIKLVFRHPDHWSTYPSRNYIVLGIAWLITAMLLGVAASRYERMRSWVAMSVGTVTGSLLVMGTMLFTVEKIYGSHAPPKFKSTEAMMQYFAGEAGKWVKHDRGIDLDYSLASVQVIEEELNRIARDVNPANPQPGTFGLATAYGAYIGEVLRRQHGGSWAVDHEMGTRTYPLTTRTNETLFPVIWCYKRLTIGSEENVYHKALLFTQRSENNSNATTNINTSTP